MATVEIPVAPRLHWDANRKRFVQDGSTPGAILIDGAPYTLEGEPPIAQCGTPAHKPYDG